MGKTAVQSSLDQSGTQAGRSDAMLVFGTKSATDFSWVSRRPAVNAEGVLTPRGAVGIQVPDSPRCGYVLSVIKRLVPLLRRGFED
jgi:hypothetical protein